MHRVKYVEFATIITYHYVNQVASSLFLAVKIFGSPLYRFNKLSNLVGVMRYEAPILGGRYFRLVTQPMRNITKGIVRLRTDNLNPTVGLES